MSAWPARADNCFSCGQVIRDKLYLVEDKVSRTKERFCPECAALTSRCFVCGVPTKKDFSQLQDGRYLCKRDSRSAVLQESDARALFNDTADELRRLVARFVKLPEKNVSMTLVDRVTIQNLFKFPGRDYECPNVWGYHQMVTNKGSISHEIAILSGLPTDVFRAVCAHEMGHAWIGSNVPRTRQGKLHSDAAEAFCELLAWMLANAEGNEPLKEAILHNVYTRGQIGVFIDAERQYGMADLVDWMQAGEDSRLSPDDPSRVRVVENQRVKTRILPIAAAPAMPAPQTLLLKGVAWNPQKPLAIINGCTFGVNEENKVPLGSSNVLVRCLWIGERSARVRVVPSGEEKELVLQKH